MVFPVVKPHIMDPNGKSSKGVVTLRLWPSYPHKPTVIYEFIELCIFGNGAEGEIPVDASK